MSWTLWCFFEALLEQQADSGQCLLTLALIFRGEASAPWMEATLAYFFTDRRGPVRVSLISAMTGQAWGVCNPRWKGSEFWPGTQWHGKMR